MKKQISFTLNNELRTIDVANSEILLHVLREKMGVTSPKCGCERGDCGSCTIMINGRTVKSCLVLAVEVDGQEVTTLEGLMSDGITKVQEAMLKNNSFQCGYCAPGFIMSAHELLERNSHPTEDEIKEALSGNLCRCTGYSPIIDAVKHVCKCKE